MPRGRPEFGTRRAASGGGRGSAGVVGEVPLRCSRVIYQAERQHLARSLATHTTLHLYVCVSQARGRYQGEGTTAYVCVCVRQGKFMRPRRTHCRLKPWIRLKSHSHSPHQAQPRLRYGSSWSTRHPASTRRAATSGAFISIRK